MRMNEANLFPVIPHLYVERHTPEVMSMSDYVHTGRRSRIWFENGTIESRLMFSACYVLFLFRAVAARLMPWHKQADPGRSNHRKSIFAEARSEAGTIVTSSFMGL
ncbi:MAG TPA: hypothetical protein VF396_24505 [Bradyrhizobium sp.]